MARPPITAFRVTKTKRDPVYGWDGIYLVTAPDGRTFRMYRDPHTRNWLDDAETGSGGGQAYRDGYLGDSKEEAIKHLIDKYGITDGGSGSGVKF